ncbi:MAG: hypothetical protein Phog2KO_19820 [Phototrophicaceae bacterium]
MRRLVFLLCFIFLVFPFSAFAQQDLPPIDPATVTGDINIAGSPILVPTTNNLVTRFSLEGYQGNITVSDNGTDAAIQQLCSAEVDIVLADRQINPTEVDACTSAGRPPIAFRVATAAVIVTTARQNTFAINISRAELQQIFGSALSWSDVRPDWPTDPIGRFIPSADSTEFDLFSDIVFAGNDSLLSTSVGTQVMSDPNAAVQSISISPTAIGFFEANFALLNSNLLTGVTIDGIAPTYTTVTDASYPLSRPLFLYTTSAAFTDRVQVASFLNYYISNVEVEADSAGLLPALPTSIDVAKGRWLAAASQSPQTTVVETAQPTAITLADPVSLTATALANVDVEAPIATPAAAATLVFQPEVQNILIQARLDLELTAQQAIGAERPIGWSGSLDIDNPDLPLLTRLDLELLAAQVYGIDDRPDDWFGAVSSTQEAISRDIRHDLEIIADDIFGASRPAEWAGGNPLYSCDRSTQALVSILDENGLYTLTANPLSPDYCMQVAIEISRFVEVNLLNTDVRINQEGVSIPPEVTIETTIAVSFYNTSASQRAGVIPVGTGITPIGRSYLGFSNMTLIQGENFLLFVEWQNTSLTQAEWRSLPNVTDLEFQTNCSTLWCQGG